MHKWATINFKRQRLKPDNNATWINVIKNTKKIKALMSTMNNGKYNKDLHNFFNISKRRWSLKPDNDM